MTVKANPQEIAPLSIHDALTASDFVHSVPFTFSPNAEWLTYVLRNNRQSVGGGHNLSLRTGVPEEAVGADIYVMSTRSRTATNLTKGGSANWLPTWSPDGRFLAFLSDRNGKHDARLWLWEIATGALRELSKANVRTDSIEWTRDARSLIVTIAGPSPPFDARREPVSARLPRSANQGLAPSVTVYQATATPPGDALLPKSDPWNLDLYVRDLVSIDASTGKVALIAAGRRITRFLLSPDGSHVAFSTPTRFERAGSQQILFDISTATLDGKSVKVLATGARLDYDGSALSWSPDGRLLSFQSGGPATTVSDCYVVAPEFGNARNVTHLPERHKATNRALPPLWDTKGENIYFVSNGELWSAPVSRGQAVKVSSIPNREIKVLVPYLRDRLWTIEQGKATVVITHDDLRKQDGFYRVDLAKGESKPLLERGQCYTCSVKDGITSVTNDGKLIAFVAEDGTHSWDVSLSDSRFNRLVRLTNINPQFDKYRMGSTKLIDWLDMDGVKLRGALLLPSDYREGRRYPLIVWIYGGRFLSNRFDYFGLAGTGPFNLQLLATRGYAVLLPDAPQNPGTPMLDLVKTVLPGVNKAIELGIADGDRLGIIGQSYGAYSALALVAQTTRFKAAVAIDGFGDLTAAYGQLDSTGSAFQTSVMEAGQGLMVGTPWQYRERYTENSPATYLNRVETPLLLVHGAADRTVSVFLSDELFVGLRRLGKAVKYARYEGEDHSLPTWKYSNQEDFCGRMVNWFERYIPKKDRNTGGLGAP